MHPNVKDCFFDGAVPADVVLDMVYNPLETALLRRARQQKRTVVPGTKMFLEQAARQFEIWTGSTAPRAVMDRAMAEALAHK
jgi:3-dehydroquinate dehydratase/shikimate dehydrogenase